MTEQAAQLYLFSPTADVDRTQSVLDGALAGGTAVACVLLRTTLGEAALGSLVRVVQGHGAAALLDTIDWELARRVGADGLHIDGGAVLPSVLRRVKPDGIVGVGNLPTRDDAMTAGEGGIDYVMFGELPDETDFETRLDRVAWWAEIFQVPCVAVTRHLDEIAPFVAAGAEFIGVGDAVWNDPEGPAAALRKAERAIAAGHEAYLARGLVQAR